MAITVVQHAQGQGSGSSGTVTAAVTLAATGAGNSLVAVVSGVENAGANVASYISATAGNIGFNTAVGVSNGFGGVAILYLSDVATGTTSVSVSVGYAGGGIYNNVTADVYEVSGAISLDQSGSGSGTGTAWSAAAPATLQAAEFWVGGAASFYAASTATGPGAPWTTETAIANTGNGYDLEASSSYQITSSTGTPSYSGTFGTSQTWAAAVATFSAVIDPLKSYPYQPLGITTELLLNGTWTDISTRVRARDPIVITRGRQDEASSLTTAQMTLTLDNTNGDFSPRNTAGAYYPYITRNTQIRVSVNAASGYRFWGEVSTWPPQWDLSGRDVFVQITASGVTRRYAQNNPAGSALKRFYTLSTAVPPVAYWPCEEQSTATQFANVIIPGDDFTWSGTPGISSNSDFAGSDPIPLVSKSTWTATTGSYSTSGNDVFTTPGSHTWTAPGGITTVQAECWGAGGGGGAANSSTATSGSAGGSSTFTGDSVTVTAHGGGGGAAANGFNVNGAGGAGGSGSTNTAHFSGGGGAAGSGSYGGGGGGSGGTASAGNNAGTQPAGATAVTGGGPGGAGGTINAGSAPSSGPGGGGGGGDAIVGGNGRAAAGGGGGGEYAKETSVAVTPGNNYTAVVGAAGSGGSSGYLGGNGYAGKVALTYTASSTPNNVVVRFLLSVPSTGATNGAVLVKTVISSGTLGRTEVYYGTGGKLGFRGYTLSSGGSLVFDSGLIAFGVDGTPVMISGELAVSGGNINWAINGIQPGSTLISVTGNTGSFAGTIGAASQVVVNPGGTVNDTAIGHVVVQYGFEALTAVSNALSGHAGERAADRFTRLLTEEGVGYQLVGTNTDTPLMGPQTDQPILALLQECEDADRGILYEPRGQFGIAYRTRVNLQNQTAALALDYTAGHISNMTPTDDDQLTRNDVTISRVNGASAREYLASGALSVQAPPNGVGAYVYTATVNLNTDSQCDPEAQWVLAVGTVDEERYPLVEINLARTQLTSVLASAAALNCGDYFTITNQPAWLPSGTVKQLAWGFTETITYPRVWEIQINAVPESPYEGTGLPTW